MSKKPLLFLTPSVRLFGARKSLLTTIENLPDEYTPHIICPTSGGLQDELQVKGFHHRIIRHYNWRKGKYFFHRFWEISQIKKFISEIRPCIVICNEFYMTPYAVKSLRNSKIPIISYMRLSISPRQIKNYYLSKSDLIICVSHAAAQFFSREPWYNEKVRVLYNAVDFRDWEKSLPDKTNHRIQFRNKFGIKENDFLVGLVGVISPRKRQHIAINAVHKIKGLGRSVHLAIVGEPRNETAYYLSELKELTRSLNLENNIHFCGFLSNMEQVYPAFDANLLISDEEGFGRVCIEAGLHGVPTIGTKIGGIPEIIKPGQTGELINLDDTNTLAEILNHWAANEEVLKSLGQNAHAFIRDNFSIQAHMQQLTKFFDEVINKKNSSNFSR